MEYKELREEAFEANIEIMNKGLAIYTWGNVSAFDPAAALFAIKPSGVEYGELRPESMVLVDIEGRIVDGALKPSSDTETHRVLYREFKGIRGVTHTHSTFATALAQARLTVPVLGTTHADNSAVGILCTPFLSKEAVKWNYEMETGVSIVECMRAAGVDHFDMPMILAGGHGPFTWGKSAQSCVYHAVVLEQICRMAYLTLNLNPEVKELPSYIIRKHWERKNGANAYYGQDEDL